MHKIPNIKPNYPYVLLLPEEPDKPQNIVLPDTIPQEPNRGIVLRSSVDQWKQGDHVQWKDLAGTYIDDFILVKAEDILPMLLE